MKIKTSLIKMQITVKVNEDINVQIDVYMKQIRCKICKGIKVLLHNERWGDESVPTFAHTLESDSVRPSGWSERFVLL